MTIILFLFWSFAFLLSWTLVLYPLTIFILSIIRPKPWKEGLFTGKVRMIVPVHNEKEVIREKVENCLNLDFGSADWEVVIVSDGSTDGTNEILTDYENISERLKIIKNYQRAGKANALNLGVAGYTGDVLIFSDANVIVAPESATKLLKPFCDTNIGAVCAKVMVCGRGDGEIAGESLYMKFEGLVQRAEARFGNMIGIDGALFAIRRKQYRKMEVEMILDDFALSMEAPLAGLRIVYAEDATAVEEVEASVANEYKRKSRIIAGGYQYLFWMLKNGRKLNLSIWFSFVSRKILRWLAPLFMICAFICNIVLLDISAFIWLFSIQAIFYSFALVGCFYSRLRRRYLFYIPYYFCAINIASLSGLFCFLFKKNNVLWDKVNR